MTAQQKLAANPQHSIWVTANAGTGKTKVLVDRVLRLLLDGNDAANILCLTYTNAAAGEMKNRIYGKLSSWAIMLDADLSNEIHSITDNKPDIDLLNYARRIFAHITDDQYGLNIQTIHSYCSGLIKQFPFEAGVSPNVQLAEDEKIRELLVESKNILIHRTELETSNLEESLRYLAYMLPDMSIDKLFKEIVDNRNNITNFLQYYKGKASVHHTGLSSQDSKSESVGTYEVHTRNSPYNNDVAAAIAGIYSYFNLTPDITAETLLESTIDKIDENAIRNFIEALSTGSKTDLERQRLLYIWVNSHDKAAQFDLLLKAFFTDKCEPRKKCATKKIMTHNPSLEDFIPEIQNQLTCYISMLNDILMVKSTACMVAIACEVLSIYADLKEQKNVLDYNDLVYLSAGLLGNSAMSEWIAYKVDNRVDHILVDEAQDTAPEQWQLIDAITSEFFAGDSGKEEKRTLFVVGDEKQSIYSFQGADIENFMHMHLKIKGKAQNSGNSWHSVTLDKSFRSTSAVLGMVDKIFSKEEYKDYVIKSKEYPHHNVFRHNQAGLVELWPLIELEKEEVEGFQLPITQIESHSEKTEMARYTAGKINEWISNGRIMKSKGRAIIPKDIMILVRGRDDFIPELVRSLEGYDIAVSGVDRMRVTEHIAVMDLIALGKFMLMPNDNLNLAVILKSPLIGLSEDDLFTLAYNRGGHSLWRRLSDSDFTETYNFLMSLLKMADRYSPFYLYGVILEKLEGRKKITARLGEEVGVFLDEFLNLSLQYESANTASLQGFISWIESNNVEVKRDQEHGVNAVRIMTVHGSKGLQSPIVIMPDSHKPSKTEKKILQKDNILLWATGSKERNSKYNELLAEQKEKEFAEYMRLLYVAMTRAEDELYIGGIKQQRMGDNCWYNIVKSVMVNVADTEDDVLRYAEHQEFQATNNDNIESTDKQKIIELPDYLLCNATAEINNELAILPSIDAEKAEGNNNPTYLRGTIIHKLLQIIPNITDKEKSIDLYLSKYKTGFSESELDKIKSQVQAVLSSEELQFIFGKNSQAEVQIKDNIGGKNISGQIDRLVFCKDYILIVDFKTNQQVPNNIVNIPSKYIKQLNYYKSSISKIFPDTLVKTAILWTETKNLMVI